MSKYYYVDSENVGDEWIKLLERKEEDARFLIFYTAKSPYMSYPNVVKLLSLGQEVTFILCQEGNNALDFQLVTYLGYQLCKEPESEIYIVSKDTGFDAVIHFWEERNISIHRICSANYKVASRVVPVSAAAEAEAIAAAAAETEEEKVCGESKEEIDDIIAACQEKNTPLLHLFLTKFYGGKNGLNIYKYVNAKEYEAVPRNWDKKTRFDVLCRYIEKYADVPHTVITGEMIDFLYLHRNNPANALKLLQERYGARYKKIFKPYVKSLAKI